MSYVENLKKKHYTKKSQKSHSAEKLYFKTLFYFETVIQLKGGPFGAKKNSQKKSHSAEKTSKGGPLVCFPGSSTPLEVRSPIGSSYSTSLKIVHRAQKVFTTHTLTKKKTSHCNSRALFYIEKRRLKTNGEIRKGVRSELTFLCSSKIDNQ